MQFNEFQRALRESELSENAQYVLTYMFEVQVEFSKSLDLTLELMEQLADKLQQVTNINQGMLEAIKELKRRGMHDGVEVHGSERSEMI